MGELRWILLGLGLLAIGAIWWWSARRSGQAAGNSELREPTAPSQGFGAPVADAPVERRAHGAQTRDWGVPPFEPLSIHTAEVGQVPPLDEPMRAHADPPELIVDLDGGITERRRPSAPVATPAPMEATSPAPWAEAQEAPRPVQLEMPQPPPSQMPQPAAPPPAAALEGEPGERQAGASEAVNSSERQKIIAVRVCTVGEARWPGERLIAALDALGLAYGRYQVFHRNHSDGRSIFCVASLIEPGTFDAAHMAQEDYRGVTFFAVLPGPLEPLQTVDALLATARDLARVLSGILQDAKGMPLSPQRAATLREDVAKFQALHCAGPV